VGSVKPIFSARVRIGRSRSSKVIDFGTNRKRVGLCDFRLVRHSNLGPILPRFRDIAGCLLRSWPHSYSNRILACSCWIRVANEKEKLWDGESGDDEVELIWFWRSDEYKREMRTWLTKWAGKLIPPETGWCMVKWAYSKQFVKFNVVSS